MMDKEALYNFFRAVLAGTLAGGGLFLFFTVPMGVEGMIHGLVLEGIYMAVFPVLVAGGVVLTAMVVIGLPLTALLHFLNAECQLRYITAGAVFGAIIPVIVFHELLQIGLILAIPSVAAGTITGALWGDFRMDRVKAAAEEPANPIHDLIY